MYLLIEHENGAQFFNSAAARAREEHPAFVPPTVIVCPKRQADFNQHNYDMYLTGLLDGISPDHVVAIERPSSASSVRPFITFLGASPF